jgi:hypothetical protein
MSTNKRLERLFSQATKIRQVSKYKSNKILQAALKCAKDREDTNAIGLIKKKLFEWKVESLNAQKSPNLVITKIDKVQST